MQESGCRLEHPSAAKFRESVMDGDWDRVSGLNLKGCCLAPRSLVPFNLSTIVQKTMLFMSVILHLLIGFCSSTKADSILKELLPLLENKEDVSVSV